jgi:hypothetical protein
MGESREKDFHPRMKLLYTTGITFWWMASFWNLPAGSILRLVRIYRRCFDYLFGRSAQSSRNAAADIQVQEVKTPRFDNHWLL